MTMDNFFQKKFRRGKMTKGKNDKGENDRGYYGSLFLITDNNEVQIPCARHPEYVNSSKFNPKFFYERRNYEAFKLILEIFDILKFLIKIN